MISALMQARMLATNEGNVLFLGSLVSIDDLAKQVNELELSFIDYLASINRPVEFRLYTPYDWYAYWSKMKPNLFNEEWCAGKMLRSPQLKPINLDDLKAIHSYLKDSLVRASRACKKVRFCEITSLVV
jgi:hypothetical protein